MSFRTVLFPKFHQIHQNANARGREKIIHFRFSVIRQPPRLVKSISVISKIGRVGNWVKIKNYLLDTEELDPLKFSLEVPFRKLEVLEPLYLLDGVLDDLDWSEKKRVTNKKLLLGKENIHFYLNKKSKMLP